MIRPTLSRCSGAYEFCHPYVYLLHSPQLPRINHLSILLYELSIQSPLIGIPLPLIDMTRHFFYVDLPLMAIAVMDIPQPQPSLITLLNVALVTLTVHPILPNLLVTFMGLISSYGCRLSRYTTEPIRKVFTYYYGCIRCLFYGLLE